MRLLRFEDGKFSLAEYVRDIPPYAILSHTWGADHEEVSFKDLVKNTNDSRPGYEKLRFCGQRAADDGLQYFWVDTCCIDKSSSAELSEAINSMFQWYRKAVKCYAYLSDVSTTGPSQDKQLIQKSRWFSRGWTLQELIAPASVEFFSVEGHRIGDKHSLQHILHETTGIPIEALQGSSLSQFTINERMSWAERRETKREEDAAYSLLGLFDIHMPLIYGEGREKAFNRLRREIHLTQRSDAKQAQIFQWLTAPDPSLKYQEALKQRQPNTGRWFVDSEMFQAWKAEPISPLWLYGIPGCGKTILSSTIIEHVLEQCVIDPSKVITYFYFDFNDTQRQRPELMIKSLIIQIAHQTPRILPALEKLFSSSEDGHRQPSIDSLLTTLQEMLKAFLESYVIIDALDECSEQPELLRLLEIIAGWQLRGLHLMLTSRRERGIEASLSPFVVEEYAICLEHQDIDQDIRAYVCQRLENDNALKKWNKDPQIRQEIESALMNGARGMFRWVACQLDTLGKCLNRTKLRQSLKTLPTTLGATYERILCSIDDDYVEYAQRILQWLAFSSEPLFLEEIAQIVAIDPDRELVFDEHDILEDPFDVLRVCSSLISVSSEDDLAEDDPTRSRVYKYHDNGKETPATSGRTVTLAHYSVKEYLVSSHIQRSRVARFALHRASSNAFLARSCLGYLSQFDDEDSFAEMTIPTLALYSAEHCFDHVQNAGEDAPALSQQLLKFLVAGDGAYRNWARIFDSSLDRNTLDIPGPLYYASYAGMKDVVGLLIEESGADVNATGGRYYTALQAICSSRNPSALLQRHKIIQILLDNGADVNAYGGFYHSALQAICSCDGPEASQGSEEIVQMLLRKGANVNAQGGQYGSALNAAAYRGHSNIIDLLVANGATINFNCGKLGISNTEGSQPQEFMLHYTAPQKKTLTSVIVYHGSYVDGLEFVYYDGTTQLFGTRNGKPGGTEFPLNHSLQETITGFQGRCGHWIDAIQILTSSGRCSDLFGSQIGGGPFTIKPPKGYCIIGISGSYGPWVDGFQVIFGREEQQDA